ncbi:MAG: DUF4342 domain-containing protein [Aggregatilineales bacterium]
MTDQQQQDPESGDRRTFTEELEVAGNQLVERVRELIEQGNIRRLIIRNSDGRTLLEIPLTIGVVAGGALAIFYPVLAGLAVIGGLVARVRIEIVRDLPAEAKEKVEELAERVEDAVEDLKDDR